jgi:hypothetical protein
MHALTSRMAINIPRDDWNEFLENIGLQHEGWVVAVERIDKSFEQTSDDGPGRALELHESTLDAVDVEIDEDEATLILTFVDNNPLHIENLARVSYDEVEEQDGKIIDLETRDRQIIRLWLRMPKVGQIEDPVETDLEDEIDAPPPVESLLQIKRMP